MGETKARAAGYVRTEPGREKPERQRAAVKTYARKSGCTLVALYEDPGVSGTTAPGDRPGFQRVAELAEAGEIDILIVHRLDRIGNDLSRVLPAVEWLRDQGVGVLSATERIDTSVPPDAAVFAVLATLGIDAPDEAALLRLVYGLRRRGRRVGETAAAADGMEPDTGK